MRFTLSVLSVALLFLGGCSAMEYTFTEYGEAYKTAEDCYSVGDLDGAVENSIASLSRKPNYEKADRLLREVAPRAYQRHEEKAREYENRADWDGALTEYDTLLALAERVSYLRGDYPTIDTQKIIGRREEAIRNIAETHYSKGVSLMDSGSHREAAQEFKECQYWSPAYKDAQSLYMASRAKVLKRVAVMPFENRTGKTQFGDIGTLLTDQIIAIAFDLDPEFAEFISRDHLYQLMQKRQLKDIGDVRSNPGEMGRLLGVHAFVFGRIHSLTANYPPETSVTHDREAIIYREEEEGGSYKVSAKATYYTRKGEVTVAAGFQIYSVVRESIVRSDTLKANAVDEVVWVRYKGDERALTFEDEDLSAQGERTPEPEGILAGMAIEHLSNSIALELVDFFR